MPLESAPEPAFSDEGGVKTASLELTLTAPEGSTIYYTTDCSTPTTASTPYTGPISIAENTVVRAIAVRDGYLPSTTATRTYITEDTHTVRVVSLVTDDKYLFSDEMGMYADGPNWQEEWPHGSSGVGANFWMDWEYPVHVEVWEADGTRLIEQDGSFKLNGQYSRALDQKSFAVYARSEYGDEDRFYAPLFSDREYTDYKSFVLRCTGQDYNRSRMRDAMITGTMEGQDVMYQETEVCVLYLNGEYWGHYNMRERVNKWSVAQWEGVTDESVIDNIDLLKGNGNRANRVLNGDNTEYRELIDFCRNNSLPGEPEVRHRPRGRAELLRLPDRGDLLGEFRQRQHQVLQGSGRKVEVDPLRHGLGHEQQREHARVLEHVQPRLRPQRNGREQRL